MSYPIAEFIRDLPGVACSSDPMEIRRKSRDRYAVSPLLRTMLEGKSADVVVSPKTLDEVKNVVRAAFRHRIPIVARGGGTANYGQSVPLKGGIMLDMLDYAGIVSLKPGTIRAKAGTIVEDMEIAAKEIGWELRQHPTTKRTATIGGYIGGGSAGPGAITYGGLDERGNIAGCQVVTMEEEPRVLELRGPDSLLVQHTYGATGIITEVEMPLAPAWNWIEAIVAFPDYMQAVRFGVELGNSPALTKKIDSVQEWPVGELIAPFARLVPKGHSICSTMIAQECWQDFVPFVRDCGGTVVSEAAEGMGPYGAPLTEFVYGHALWSIRKTDPRRAVIEGFFRDPDLVGLIGRVHEKVRHYGPMRTEIARIGGSLVSSGSPYFVYESAEQMTELVTLMQSAGARVANSHTSNVRAVGKKRITQTELDFKRSVDPHGLLNPGRFETDVSADATFEHTLPTDGWELRHAGRNVGG